MPDARVHDAVTLAGATLLIPATWAIPSDNRWLSCAMVSGGHLLSGWMFSCDLDVSSEQAHRWGPLRWLWWPYERLVAHRSWLSHGLIVGPLLRVLYFAVILEGTIAGLCLGLQAVGGPGLLWLDGWHRFWQDIALRYPRRVLEFAVGFVLAGTSHSVLDWIQTGIRRVA